MSFLLFTTQIFVIQASKAILTNLIFVHMNELTCTSVLFVSSTFDHTTCTCMKVFFLIVVIFNEVLGISKHSGSTNVHVFT